MLNVMFLLCVKYSGGDVYVCRRGRMCGSRGVSEDLWGESGLFQHCIPKVSRGAHASGYDNLVCPSHNSLQYFSMII